MDWTVTLRNTEGSYKELFIKGILHNSLETENYKYISLKQFGASVVALVYYKLKNKYDIEYYLLQKDRQYGFSYKKVDWTEAPYKAIPKSWLNKLEQTRQVLQYRREQFAYVEKRVKLPTYKSLIGKQLEFTLRTNLHIADKTFNKGQMYTGKCVDGWGIAFENGIYIIRPKHLKRYIESIVVID